MLRIRPIQPVHTQACSNCQPCTASSGFQRPSAPTQTSSAGLTGLWGSIAIRFNGFSSKLSSLAAQLETAASPAEARDFFARNLQSIVELASKNPDAARKTLASATPRARPLWRNMLMVACGDGAALAPALTAIEEDPFSDEDSVADCVAMVARARPVEGRFLAKHAVRFMGPRAQVRMMESLVNSRGPGSKRLIGELFEEMMERAAQEERVGLIYPSIERIAFGNAAENSPGRGFLGVLYRGWISEAQGVGPDFKGAPGIRA